MRSSNNRLLDEPRANLKTHGERVFSVAAPRLWNKLPLQIRFSSSEAIFKANLSLIFLSVHFFFVTLLYYIAHLILRILVFRVLEYCKAPWTINGRWRYINVYLFIHLFVYLFTMADTWQLLLVIAMLLNNIK